MQRTLTLPRQFKLLVFDWDGTLMDSAAAIAASLQAACRDVGLPEPSTESARFVIGLGLEDAIQHVAPGAEPQHYPVLRDRYRVHFLERDAATTLFAGAAETIAELRAGGYLLGVATGKSRRGLDRALVATGLDVHFHATRCADECPPKPHPGMLLSLMEALGTTSRETLMIGDTTHDMAMAAAAGVTRLAVTYGAHARESLAGFEPVACLDDFPSLRSWLREHA